MEPIQVLEKAARRVYDNVKHLPGTRESAGDFGRGAGGDISRGIDILAEKTVLDYLKEINFSCTVLGEECGRIEILDKSRGYIVMDAVDGSTNAVRGIPFSCCSLAFATGDKLSSVTDAVIIDLYTGDLYSASKGKGAFMNGKRIQVHKEQPLYFVVGLDISGITSESLQRLSPIISASNHIRHFGAVALELAIFARGLVDLFVDIREKLRVTDVAAGCLIATEAGGIIVGKNGKPVESNLSYDARISFIAASSKEILNETMKKLELQ
ncbi:MAG TPA: inositol monophosphatase family protein [Candidatus Bathyarchaeia archaeon]|nr:inositol monophosphatase family protein [Candidatus Bathyarchaeia archaeon]